MSIRRTFRLREQELTVVLKRHEEQPSINVIFATDDSRSWSGTYPNRPKLAQVSQGLHELERQGPMIQYRAKELQAIRNWISQVAGRDTRE